MVACAVAPPTPRELPPAAAPSAASKPAPKEVAIARPALPPSRYSSAATLGAYQKEFAERVHAVNAGHVYEGAPPNPLRAVIVYRTEIDASGHPVRVELFRSPGAPRLEARAADSVRRAAPFLRPRPELLRGGRLSFIETWLFDYEGRFRLRTLALPQASE